MGAAGGGVDGVRVAGAAVTVVAALVVGAATGLMLPRRSTVAQPDTPFDQALTLLAEDAPRSTLRALELLQGLPSSSPQYILAQLYKAMALAMKAVDGGGSRKDVEAASRALAAVGDEENPIRRTPPVLLARHLLSSCLARPDANVAKDLARMLEERPEDPWTHLVAGRIAEETGEVGMAMDAYRHAVHVNSRSPWALLGLSRAHARVGDATETRRLLERLLALQPNHAGALELGLMVDRTSGSAFSSWQRQARAVMDLKETPGDARARLALALALLAYAQGDMSGFHALLERASAVNEDDRVALHDMARMRLAMGDADLAVTLLEKALEREPEDVELRKDWARAKCAAALGSEWVRSLKLEGKDRGDFPVLLFPLGAIHAYPGSRKPWETVLNSRLFPDPELAGIPDVTTQPFRLVLQRIRSITTVGMAGALLAKGRGREAKTLLRALLEENRRDRDIEVLLMLARVEAATQDLKEAERHLKEVVEIRQSGLDTRGPDPRALLLLARLALDAGDPVAAHKHLRALESVDLEIPRLHAFKARTMAGTRGGGDGARKALDAARDHDAQDPEVGVATAMLALAAEDEDAALKEFTAVAQVSPQRMLALARAHERAAPLVGKALFDAGSPEDGMAILQEFVEAHPDDPSGFLYLGLVQQSLRDNTAALNSLERFWRLADATDRRCSLAARAFLAVAGNSAPRGVGCGKASAVKPRKDRR